MESPANPAARETLWFERIGWAAVLGNAAVDLIASPRRSLGLVGDYRWPQAHAHLAKKSPAQVELLQVYSGGNISSVPNSTPRKIPE
jgi:hypothetical protein